MNRMRQPTVDPLPTSQTGRSALEVAIDAARRAGQIIQDRFLTPKTVSFKGPSNPVTDVDLAAEQAVLGVLRAEYPEFGIISEESKPVETASPFTWVVDPLDGTRNYAAGIPHFCVVVALAQKNPPRPPFIKGGIGGISEPQHPGEPEVVLGVTYDPVRQELFTAQRGKGAFMNGIPISVSKKSEMAEALLAFDLGYLDEAARLALDMVRALWPGLQSMRLMGSSALGLAYAAAGRVDLYFHHSLAQWDVASGLLLVREAGGLVVDRQGHPGGLHTPSVIASSPRLVERFLQATDGMAWRR
jgi:fructose-1,6-bisphosphatase/inositol monophosphatase family enzyme